MTPQETTKVLSQPLMLNKLTLKNRMVMGPMAAHSPDKEGRPTDQTVAFFEARARGGVSMIIMGGTQVTRRGFEEVTRPGGIRADLDAYIPDFKRIADAVHAHGAAIIAEMTPHMGRVAHPPISASPMSVVMKSSPRFRVPGGEYLTPVAREATIAEIEEFERGMVDGAERFHRSGWDGVEIPAIMSYFLSSFVSPRTNWRTDQYGGSVENRARILVNIVKGIRERLGPDFVVGLRITADDYMPDSPGPEDFAAVAKEVEKAGIDYVALTYGCYESAHILPLVEGAIDRGASAVFKRVLSTPVMVGELHDPAHGAAAIAEGRGDLVMLARPVLADPDYARKVGEGRIQDIVRCDRDNYCMKRLLFNMPIRCTVNARMGRESRAPGALPPIDRMLKGPVEKAVFAIATSKPFLDLADAAMKMKKPKQPHTTA